MPNPSVGSLLPPKRVFIIISLGILFFGLIIPAIIPWFVVLIFVVFTLKLALDGVSLHKNLLQELQGYYQQICKDLYDQCEMINKENRDKINRIALIEKTCVENQSLQLWEKKKHYCQLLPNLLLALGLLGTFVGITINLFLLSRNTSGNIQLQKTLADIIGSMAIAFISSLIALLCSIFLNRFYPSYDLDIERDNLLSRLENYLDNDYFLNHSQPTLQEKIEELKISIIGYANKLDTFVVYFPQYIQNFEYAITVASQKLITSTNNFGDITSQSSQIIEVGANSLSKSIQNLTRLTNNFSDIVSSLDKSALSFENATETLQSYTQQLQVMSNNLVNHSSRIQSIIQNNQQGFIDCSAKLEKNAQILASVIQSFIVNISQMKEMLNEHTGQIGNNTLYLQNLGDAVERYTQILKSVHKEISTLVTLFSQSQNS